MKTYKELIEGKKVDSKYLIKTLEDGLDDLMDEDEGLYNIIKNLTYKLEQSYPDGDITEKELKAILTEPKFRKLIKKAKTSISDVLWWIMNGV